MSKKLIRATVDHTVYTSASVNTINGGAETCDHCHDPIDCESCEKPEQWEKLHEENLTLRAWGEQQQRHKWRYLRACKRVHREWRKQAHVSRACLFGDCVPVEELNAAKATRDTLDRKLDLAMARIEELTRIAGAAQAREGLLRDKLTEANARIADMQRLLDARKERENAANARIERYASQYTENQARMQRVSREFADACDERDSARAEVERLEDEITLRRGTVAGVALDWIGRFIAAPLLERIIMAAMPSKEPADHPFGAMWGKG